MVRTVALHAAPMAQASFKAAFAEDILLATGLALECAPVALTEPPAVTDV